MLTYISVVIACVIVLAIVAVVIILKLKKEVGLRGNDVKKALIWLMLSCVLSSFLVGAGVSVSAANTAVLRNKKALFAGDSITYGYKDSASSPRSWALRLQRDYGMSVTNKGQNGHSLSDVRDYTQYGNDDKRLHKKCFDAGNYDYVILQGGVNDIIGAEAGKGHPKPSVAVAVGSIAATKNVADFDTSTFAGGLERYFYEATTRYPNAKIGFIITYQTPNSTQGGNTRNAEAYWNIAREICAKWDIPYLDLYDDSYSIDILKADTNVYLEDTLHLNASGYEMITPYIASWMATLQPHNTDDVTVTTTTKATTTKNTAENSTSEIPSSTSVVTSSSSGINIGKPTSGSNPVGSTTNGAGKGAVDENKTASITEAGSPTDTTNTGELTQSTHKKTTVNEMTASADSQKEKPNYTWLVVILAAASVAVLATVIVVAVRSRI